VRVEDAHHQPADAKNYRSSHLNAHQVNGQVELFRVSEAGCQDIAHHPRGEYGDQDPQHNKDERDDIGNSRSQQPCFSRSPRVSKVVNVGMKADARAPPAISW